MISGFKKSMNILCNLTGIEIFVKTFTIHKLFVTELSIDMLFIFC